MNQLSEFETDQLTMEESNEVQFIEEELSTDQAAALLNTMIKDLTAYYSINFFREWEKDHTLSKEPTDRKTQQLSEIRDQLRAYFKENYSPGDKVQLKASFTLTKSN